MRNTPEEIKSYETLLTDDEFMRSFNSNMPVGYPLLSRPMLEKYKEDHQNLFRTSKMWTLDIHRKRMILWLPQNI